MQKLLGYIRRACQEFDLIEDGDRIAVGVSGGKDSLVLLAGLALMRRFYEKKYEVVALTLDPRFGGEETDYTPVAELCERLGVEYHLLKTDIGEIVFDIRKEPNPCSLCAKMRRGALHDLAKEHGCNKLALGHNNDDAIETFMMNLFNEGRIGCFAPISYLSRKDITVIRPLVFAPEHAVAACARRNNFTIVKSKCPANKHTNRETTKELLAALEHEHKGIKMRIFGAMRKAGIDRWGYKE
ncbi:MAG: tRNA 2-thiocytidine biosynthesis TtcA family protein [Oscillospiraceae bacterium]